MGAVDTPLTRRRSGVLLHPTSLPGGVGCGDFGADAYRFVDFLAASGISVWQMLPLVPTHGDLSPYQGLSVHAGNPLLISLSRLQEWGWLKGVIATDPEDFIQYRRCKLQAAYQGFVLHADGAAKAEFSHFVAEHAAWLDDYALFQAIRQAQGNRHWLEWPAELRDHDAAALAKVGEALKEAVNYVRFEQFIFFRQWHQLRDYARQHNVLLFGDLPIFVAHDSAEVWAHRELFTLDEHGKAQVVAGVPPDYFSATSQRWGNPHYHWERMEADGFSWWKQRIAGQLEMFDWVRIDHFRGFEAYWEIPAHEATAMNGRWVTAPGDALFAALHERFDPLPLVAEDLGIITAEVDALRQKYHLPGMKILQFAFGGDASNPYLPHNQTVDSVVYTGTHDNDTTLGWYQSLPQAVQHHVQSYLGMPQEAMPWPMIRSTLASVARLAILPMQDLLELDSKHRMNTPGTSDGNWRWRFEWPQIDEALAPRLKELMALYGRC
jgi:4-alpha-glucanotransferase